MAKEHLEDYEDGVFDIDVKTQKKIANVMLRIVAVFAASGLSVIGAGSLVGIEVWQAVLLAGGLGVATVVEGLARAFLNDGKLSLDEINEVFGKIDKKSE
jgi:hypothetical protein